jgi:hypothetical protein
LSEQAKYKLKRLIHANPAFKDIPFTVADGVILTPETALLTLELSKTPVKTTRALKTVRLSKETLGTLTEDYYKRLLLKPPPHPVIVWIGSTLTPEQALEEVKARTPTGLELMASYQGLLKELNRRLG